MLHHIMIIFYVRDTLLYEIDGLVVKLNNLDVQIIWVKYFKTPKWIKLINFLLKKL